ncbi:2OG-Fe(II) oxygenase [Brevundimonas sp.]|uniref:2OG-Fe(II) oxygenase n=1 Tax=Brevundimonas sp. TaxID=1871086 RepID=UPI003F71E2B0
MVSNSARIEIDPGLKPSSMIAAFKQFGRIHIPGFLKPESAGMLHRALATEKLWLCSTMGGGQTIDVPVEQLEAFPPDQAMRFVQLAHAEARDGFHYMFDNIRISDLAEQRQPLAAELAAAYAFLNSPAFLDFVRALTGDPRPNFVDAQATRYERGHYLTQHDDSAEGKGRLYAYVLNLTPHWRSDWGGLLNFIDADGHVAEAYSPAWNALNLFRVPQAHAVSCVAPFAGAPRLSITGWVRQIDLSLLPGRSPASGKTQGTPP